MNAKECTKCREEKHIDSFKSKTGRELKMCYECRYNHRCQCGFRTYNQLNFQRHAWSIHGISFEG